MSRKASGDKLLDQEYRRTSECSKYFKVVREKGNRIPTWNDAIIPGEIFNLSYIREYGIDQPLLFKDGHRSLDMRMIDSKNKLSDVAKILGPDTPIKVMDVGAQEELDNWTFGEYANFFEHRSKEHKILNLISLEISRTPLATKIQAPLIVRQTDWIDAFWPENRRARGDFPRVQKYLLAGMQGAYTDFHVDFGGTSVWYHVLWGEKIFYFIRPTARNIKVFETWMRSVSQSNTFLPDLLPPEETFKIHLRPGDTMMIPGGWIHAVYTPVDSLVFGGNFLHFPCIGRQLAVFGIEERTRVGQKYRFPFFKQMMWYALTSMLPIARRARHLNSEDADIINSSGVKLADLEFEGDPMYDLYISLCEPKIHLQWIYLLKLCELWFNRNEITSSDMDLFLESAINCGCSDNKSLISEWWDILKYWSRIEDKNPQPQGITSSILARIRTSFIPDSSMPLSDFFQQLNSEKFLDICPLPKTIQVKLEEISVPVVDSVAVDEVASKIILPVSEPVTHDSAPLKLKLKFGASVAAAIPSVSNSTDISRKNHEEEDESRSQSGGSEEFDSSSEDEYAGSKDTIENSSVSMDKVPSKIGGIKLTLNNYEQQKNAAPKRIVLKMGEQPVKKKREMKYVEEIDTIGSREFGTRGLKLSAKFLRDAADFNASGDDNDDFMVAEAPTVNIEGTSLPYNVNSSTVEVSSTSRDAMTLPVSAVEADNHVAAGHLKKKRRRDEDFIFDVNDAADDDEYTESDGDEMDEEWMEDADEDDDDFRESKKHKKRTASSSAIKPTEGNTNKISAPGGRPIPPTQAVDRKRDFPDNLKRQPASSLGSLSKQQGLPSGNKAGTSMTVRQQLLKKLGSKYK